MRTMILILALTLSASAAETPLRNVRFEGTVNAGGHIITNLGTGFASSNGLAERIESGTWRNPDWFSVFWAQSPTSAPASVTYGATNLDILVERHGYNNVKHPRVAQISEQHGFFDLEFAVSPTNLASVSSAGFLTHLADGVVTATVTAATHGQTNLIVLRTEGYAFDRYWSAVPGSLRAAVISNVAASVTNATMQTFSEYDTNTMIFTRNTNLWVKPAPECLAAWNSRSRHYGGGALITPRHAITAQHASFRPQVGDTVRWVDSTNGVFAATVTHAKRVIGDIGIFRIDQDIPVRVAKFLASPARALPNGIHELPLALGEVHFGGHEFQLVIGGSKVWSSGDYAMIGWWKAAEQAAWRDLFRHNPVSGDSSQPVMFSTGTDFVLLFCLHYATGGPNLHAYLPEIQAAIAAWGDTNTLSWLDVSTYTEF